MKANRLVIRMTEQEISEIKKISTSFGYNVSDYVKRKLFNDNEDLVDNEKVRYICPQTDKHNLLSVSILYKMFYMVKETLSKQGFKQEEILKMEQKSLEYAREKRERQGYIVLMEESEE